MASDPRLDPDFLEREGIDQATVEAVGKLSEALEAVEIARGHLYTFHRLSGTADFTLGEAVDLLRDAGHEAFADEVARDLVGRNVLAGRWTFQIVEEYDETYYRPFAEVELRSRDLTGGHHHAYEAGLKRERRTEGARHHEATPEETSRG